LRRGCIVIPVRLDSQRLKEKALVDVKGMSMLEHVWRRARLAVSNDKLFIATSDSRVEKSLSHLPINWYKSMQNHSSGTSRVVEFMKESPHFDFVTVLQGDEILINPETLLKLMTAMETSLKDAINVVSPLESLDDLHDLNIVKCFINGRSEVGFLFRKNPFGNSLDLKLQNVRIVRGLFAISKSVILPFLNQKTISLANSESIEQFTLLENGLEIGSHLENEYYPSINTQQDLDKVLAILDSDIQQVDILKRISAI